MFTRSKQFLSQIRQKSESIRVIWSEEKGTIAIEYGLIAALVVAVVIMAISQLGTNLVALPLPSLNMAFENALS